MRQLKGLALSRISYATVGCATVGCAIVIGMISSVVAKEPGSMSQMSSQMNQMASPTAAPAKGMPTAKLSASLTPASEVPATTAKGSGSATVNVYSKEDKVCYRVSVSGLDTITGAHIHAGMAGKNGSVVIPFTTPGGKGLSVGCTTAKPALIRDLASNPSHYYINVHTKKYGKGAIRGQLAVASSAMMHP